MLNLKLKLNLNLSMLNLKLNLNMNNATTFDKTDESINQPSQLIQEFHPSQIIQNPGLRIPIDDHAPKIRSDVRRAYLLNG
jgi:hypothetical protein